MGQFQETFKQFAKKEKIRALCGLFISLIWDLSECSHGTRPGFRRLPEAVIEIVDPKADWRGLSGHASSSSRDAGRSLAEAKEEIMDLAPKLRTYFLVDDLYHLMRGGRLSKVPRSWEVWPASNPFSG